ncbi:MAG: sugar ABC transporter permease [Thermoflexales bacterium]|nr:sugar ABC transporter permease [Thermoflexales bacterium]MDW8352516.1 sugar ABC transporter permease [Anaerolineae bacterium]
MSAIASSVNIPAVRARAPLSERLAPAAFLLPAVLVVLFVSIFPLILSLFLSLSRLRFEAGGLKVQFVALDNYRKLLFGSEQKVLFGTVASPSLVGWIVLAVVVLLTSAAVYRAIRDARSVRVIAGRAIAAVVLIGLTYLVAASLLSPEGRPGTLVVTMLYVAVGITVQYLLGLVLALLCAQQLPGRRFFRVVFLLPMMITPVGVGYLFRMLADTNKGPLEPLWVALGMQDFAWSNNAWGARIAVMIGDVWQWTPFMFIVLLAAIEAQEIEPIEAAIVDGASSWDIFRHITLPAILPVSTTLILIRMIEAFKIIDLPNILTNGGPGTATETMTLYAYRIWRALDIGGSAAIAYLLLFLVTFFAMLYVRVLRSHVSATA